MEIHQIKEHWDGHLPLVGNIASSGTKVILYPDYCVTYTKTNQLMNLRRPKGHETTQTKISRIRNWFSVDNQDVGHKLEKVETKKVNKVQNFRRSNTSLDKV